MPYLQVVLRQLSLGSRLGQRLCTPKIPKVGLPRMQACMLFSLVSDSTEHVWRRKVERRHACAGARDRATILTAGSTDGIAKLLQLLSEPGDIVLCDAFTSRPQERPDSNRASMVFEVIALE